MDLGADLGADLDTDCIHLTNPPCLRAACAACATCPSASAGLFPIFIGMMHRNDFGDDKLIIRRELHAGIAPTGIFMAKTLQSSLFTFLQVGGGRDLGLAGSGWGLRRI